MSKKILVVDDSAFMRKMLIEILKGIGYDDIIEGENGQEAIDKYKSEKPDLLLLDIIMPEIGGMDVLKEIGSEANVIIISAIGQDGVIEEAKASGAKDFVVKPFNEEEVAEKVKSVLA